MSVTEAKSSDPTILKALPEFPIKESSQIVQAANVALENSGQELQKRNVQQQIKSEFLTVSNLFGVKALINTEEDAVIKSTFEKRVNTINELKTKIQEARTEQERKYTLEDGKVQLKALTASLSTEGKLKYVSIIFKNLLTEIEELRNNINKGDLSLELKKRFMDHQISLQFANSEHIDAENEVAKFITETTSTPTQIQANATLRAKLPELNRENSLDKYNVELLNQIVTLQLRHLPTGNDILKKIADIASLEKYQTDEKLANVGSYIKSTYVKIEQENSFVEDINSAQRNFTAVTKDAIDHKEKIQQSNLMQIRLIGREDAYIKGLAFNDSDQINPTRARFNTAKIDAESKLNTAIVAIKDQWKEICTNHLKTHALIKQSEEATKRGIETALNRKPEEKVEPSMYFYSRARIEKLGFLNQEYVLNQDLNAIEKKPQSPFSNPIQYPFNNVKPEAPAEVRPAAGTPTEPKKEDVNLAAIASLVKATKSEETEKPEEVKDKELVAPADIV